MTAQLALDAVLRDVVSPVVLAAGFDGSPNLWTRSAAGDWAIITVQRSGSEAIARCVVDLAVVPAPWLDYMTEWLGSPPARVTDSLGLYRERLTPSGASAGVDQWWQVRTDEDAAACAADLVRRLEERGLPLLNRLLDRATFLATLRAGDLGMMKADRFPSLFAFAEAVLISDQGPSDHLEKLLEVAYEASPPDRQEAADRYGDWVRARAREAG